MRKPVLILICVLCIPILLAGFYFLWPLESRAPVESSADEYRFIETACWFVIPVDNNIRCGELHTPESSGTFRLPVVRILNTSPDRRSDPVIYLQGGPGGSAQLNDEGIEYWLNWLIYADLKRDFILMDPRGVGRSKPALTCSAYDRFSLNALRYNLTQQQELEQGYAVVEQCFEGLARSGFKPEYYGTEITAQDLRALMLLLSSQNPEYESWNLLGVSYGTRVAITAANEFPSVRALILDSVYPAGYGGLQSWPALFDQSLRNFIAWCDTDRSCTPADSAPMIDRLAQALQVLREHPINIHIPRWNGEAPLDLVLNDYRFLSAVFSATYSKHEWIYISGAIDAAINGERARLQTLIETFINNAFSDSFYALAFMAVDCSDHPISPLADYEDSLKRYPLFAEYTADLWQYQACHFLSAEGEKPGLAPPLKQPSLLLAGALDPITPVAWARDMHQHWASSQLVILKDIGHAVINSDACIHENLRKFLDAPQQPFTACGITASFD